MPRKKKLNDSEDIWLIGGILAVLGLYEIIFGNKASGFAALGLGVVFMAAVNEEFRNKLTEFFFSIFKKLTALLSRN